VVDWTDPVVSLAGISENSPYAHVAGDTVYYGDGGLGGFSVQVTAQDATAGLDWVSFPGTTSDGTTFEYDGESSATPSHPYSFDASDTFSGQASITAQVPFRWRSGDATQTARATPATPALTSCATLPRPASTCKRRWTARTSK
jgi:hypothetical protein